MKQQELEPTWNSISMSSRQSRRNLSHIETIVSAWGQVARKSLKNIRKNWTNNWRRRKEAAWPMFKFAATLAVQKQTYFKNTHVQNHILNHNIIIIDHYLNIHLWQWYWIVELEIVCYNLLKSTVSYCLNWLDLVAEFR